MSSRSTGRIRMDEDSDKWTRNASVSKAADVRPNSRFGQYGGISNGYAIDRPSEANIRVIRWSAFSSDEVDKARVGRKIYGFRR